MGAVYGYMGAVDRRCLQAMGSRLRHRGSFAGEWSLSEVSLGEWVHEIDGVRLTAEQVTIVADADIYNAAQLRHKLVSRGHVFETPRDEEVILRGYLEFGAQVCEQLIGDFAFVLWDGRRGALLLARDALGSRPLYYWQNGDVFAFASEYKALLALPFIPNRVDLEALQQLQWTKYPPTNHTLLEGILSVPAGHYAEYVDGTLRLQRYWRIVMDVEDAPEDYHVQKLREQFLEVVARQVGSRAEIGATLSGGVDSAAIVAAIKKVRPEVTLHTFTCGYGPDDPEVRSAEIVAEAVGTIHHNVFITPRDIPPLLVRLVWHLEDPIARSETVLNFVTARYASHYVDVVLAGHAGDGLYGGMPRHKLVRLIQWFPPLKTPIEEFYNYTQLSAPPATVLGKALQRAFFRGGDAPAPTVQGVSLAPSVAPLPSQRQELLNQVLLLGMAGGVTKWLPKVDRTHMAHGLRCRSPFTDVELIQGAFRIPDRYKIQGWREKHIFREAVRPLLPAEVLNRPKFPQAMQYDRELSLVLDELACEILSPERIDERGFFNVTDVERLHRRPPDRAYSSEQAMRLWTAILTELWAQIYLDGRGEPVHA